MPIFHKHYMQCPEEANLQKHEVGQYSCQNWEEGEQGVYKDDSQTCDLY